MSARALAEGCFKARRRFHGIRSILYRAMDFKANCRNPLMALFFLVTNLASRQDVLRKQWMQLGMGNAA
jgi:Na+/glutamate symporter